MLANATSSAASPYRPAIRGGVAANLRTVCREAPREYRTRPPAGRRTLLPASRSAVPLPGSPIAPAPAIGPSPAPVSDPAPSPAPGAGQAPLEVSLRLADALALSIRAALERVAIPLARALAAFTARRCWEDFGFARLEDHARERFGRSGRWVNDCAALGRALESLPLLTAALTGDDGGRPIGRVAATLIGRVATRESAGAWITRARAGPIRLLRDVVRAARAAGSEWPGAGSGALEDGDSATPGNGHVATPGGGDAATPGCGDAATDELSERSLVRILVPAPVLAAFDEAVDLHRCIEGREASVTSFVEALVAEAFAGGNPPDTDRAPLNRLPDVAAVESALARSTDNWSHLAPVSPAQSSTAPSQPAASSPAAWSLALAGVSLARLRQIDRVAGTGGATDLDRQVRALLALEDELQGRLAALLADMADRGAWPRLRFAGVGHYAEERLGISRTSAEDRVRATRALRRFPLLRAAFEEGRLGLESIILILRLLGAGPVDAGLEAAWVARAEAATVKRLRDEARALGRRGLEIRRRAPEPTPHDPGIAHCSPGVADHGPDVAHRGPESPVSTPRRRYPLDDATWHASLYRAPGTARERLHRFGMAAAEALEMAATEALGMAAPGVSSPDVFLRLRLPHDLAADFLGAVESARVRLSGLVDSVPWYEPWPDPDAPPSTVAARTFSVSSRRVPAWIGVLALLEDFVHTWDPVAAGAGAGSRAGPSASPSPETDTESVPRRGPIRRPGDAVYARAGWRCMAPGCTSRRNLEDHHVIYRSRGGHDDLSNRICLCRFHHQRGEHGDLAACRGRAPLGILWRLGRKPLAVWYRNERVRPDPGRVRPNPERVRPNPESVRPALVNGPGPLHGP